MTFDMIRRRLAGVALRPRLLPPNAKKNIPITTGGNSMDTRNALKHVTVDGTLLDWLAVHGNLCLAMRHPGNDGPSRSIVVSVIYRLGKVLVDEGILTPDELESATRLEVNEHGLERFV
jgi:hypothetical protein